MKAGGWLFFVLCAATAAGCSVRESDDDDGITRDGAAPPSGPADGGTGSPGASDAGGGNVNDAGPGSTKPDAGSRSDAGATTPVVDSGAAPDTASPPPPLPPADASVPDDLAGLVVGAYAMKVHVESVAKIPLLGDQKSQTNTYAQVKIERDGDKLKTTELGCHVDIIGDPNTKTVVPDAIPKSVPAITTPFVVFRDGTTVRFSRGENPIAVGVKLTDPANDALPTSATDTRIWDQDVDSNPGITIKLQGTVNADLYAVQRPRSSISGSVTDAGMAGLVVDRTEQYVFAAKPATYKSNPTSVTYPDPSKNTVQLARITASDDCAAIMSKLTELFP